MGKDLTPEEKDRRATLKAEGRLPEAEDVSGAPTWVWIMVGVIVLIALIAGSIMGFIGGFISQPPPEADYVELLGATLSQDGSDVFFDRVYTGQAADAAGIQSGDQMISIDGTAINSVSQAKRIIERHSAGDTVRIVIKRKGLIREYLVVLGLIIRAEPTVPPVTVIPILPTPQIPQPQNSLVEARLGIYYRMLVPGDPFEVKDGALIITSWPGGPADEAGLGAGDIIISVGNTELSQSFTLENALDRYRPGEEIKLYVLTTDGEYVNVRVRLAGG